MLNSILEYKLKEKSIFLFFIGLFFNVRVNLIGQLYMGEALLFLVGVLYFKTFLSVWSKVSILRISTSLFALGFVMLLISNSTNGVSFENSMKGIANQVFYFSSLVGFIILLKNNLDGIAIYFLGKSIGNLFFYQYVNVDFTADLGDSAFEVYYATSLNFLVPALVIFVSKNRTLQLALLFAYGIICIMFDARAVGMAFFLTGLLGLLSNVRIKITRLRLVLLSVIGFPLLVMSFYNLGKSGLLGETSYKQFNEIQGSYKYISVFARSETLIGVIAWSDKPVFGHGSNAPGGHYYTLAKAIGIIESYVKDRPRIPSHSVIVGSAVEAGTFAAIQWIYLFLFMFFFLVTNWKNQKSRYFLLIIYFILATLWGLIFSPFGFARLQFTSYFAFIIIYIYEDRIKLPNLRETLSGNQKRLSNE